MMTVEHSAASALVALSQPLTTPGQLDARALRKAAKKAAKEARVARAGDPQHVARKENMIENIERASAREEELRLERARSAVRFYVWCRRRMMEEVDTDGEEL